MGEVVDLKQYRKTRHHRKVRVELSILTFIAPYDKLLVLQFVWFLVVGVVGYAAMGYDWTFQAFWDGWWGTWHRWSWFPLRAFDLFLLLWFLPVVISGTIGVRACRVARSVCRAARLLNGPLTEEGVQRQWPGVRLWVLQRTRQGFWVAPYRANPVEQGGHIEWELTPIRGTGALWFRYGSYERLLIALEQAGYMVYSAKNISKLERDLQSN